MAALAAVGALSAGCTSGDAASEAGTGGAQVRAVLSAEDAGDILPGSDGDFVVMVHLEPDGTTTPLVMLTPRMATTYAPYLLTDDSIYLMDVPEGAAWPLVDTTLSWESAIISSESQLTPDLLARTAEQLAVAATVDAFEVDSSITVWTQDNVSHMAGAYVIVEEQCLPAVVRQTADNRWLLTQVPGWGDPGAIAELVDGAASVILSDSTQVNPSRLSTCSPGS